MAFVDPKSCICMKSKLDRFKVSWIVLTYLPRKQVSRTDGRIDGRISYSNYR